MKRSLLSAFAAAILAGCASGPYVPAYSDPYGYYPWYGYYDAPNVVVFPSATYGYGYYDGHRYHDDPRDRDRWGDDRDRWERRGQRHRDERREERVREWQERQGTAPVPPNVDRPDPWAVNQGR